MSAPSRPSPARRGRPRSRASQAAVIRTARRMLTQLGYGGVTIDALARESGVGKPTIYRWWPSKGAIYREMYTADAADFLGSVDTGSLEKDLRVILRGVVRLFTDGVHGEAMAGMFAEAQLNPETFADFQQGIFAMRAHGVRRTFELARQRGELPAKFDPVLAGDLLFGPILYRLLLRHAPLDRRLADRLVREFFVHLDALRGR